jgi:hypothetical protein
MKIKFCDLNKSLVEEVSKLGIESVHGDYFMESYKTFRPVLVTASNPFWSFGGGIDAHFITHFKGPCIYKQAIQGGMERIGNICFCISVNDDIEADKDSIEKALKFAVANTYEGETLLLSGIGTGIGRLSDKDFVDVLRLVVLKNQ